MDEGYLAFATDDQYLGVAFRNLRGKTLYPMVSAVWGHCEITMKYLGGLDRELHSASSRFVPTAQLLCPFGHQQYNSQTTRSYPLQCSQSVSFPQGLSAAAAAAGEFPSLRGMVSSYSVDELLTSPFGVVTSNSFDYGNWVRFSPESSMVETLKPSKSNPFGDDGFEDDFSSNRIVRPEEMWLIYFDEE